MAQNNQPTSNMLEQEVYTKSYTSGLSRVQKTEGRRTRATNCSIWTDKELDILKKYYPEYGYKKCQEKGVDKSMYTITDKATELEIKRVIPEKEIKDSQEHTLYKLENDTRNYNTKWTSKEIDLALRYFPTGGYELCREHGLTKTEAETIILIKREMKERKAEFIKKGFMTPARWTKSDIQILVKNYPLGGTSLCQEKGLNKKTTTIRMMAKSLDIHLIKNRPWTAKEDSLLKSCFKKTGSREECYDAFVDRSKTDINDRLKELGLAQKKRWDKKEEEILKKYYPIGGASLVAEKGVKRELGEIGAKASNMKITMNESRNYWDKEEEAILIKYYPKEGMKVLKRLPNKDIGHIRNKVLYMKLEGPANKWSKEEVKILRKYYPIEGGKVIKRLPGKTSANIYYKASSLGITKIPRS